jgi:DNA-binding IclR family transcriptional regulator
MHLPRVAPARTGTQAVERALTLLHVISADAGRTLPLSRISRNAGLDAGTTRRLLLALMRKGFVAQDVGTGQYHLGLDFFSVAAAAANRFDTGEKRRTTLKELSRRAGTAAAFFLREDSDMICIDVVHGPGEPPGLDIGARRPIGSEAFGMALLAALPDEEGEAIVIRNVRRYSRTPEPAVRQVGERLRNARRRGFAGEVEPFSSGWSLAVAVTNRDGRAIAAMGVSATGRIPADLAPVAANVMAAAEALQADLWRLPVVPVACTPARMLDDATFTM